jgi:hypothetical protein
VYIDEDDHAAQDTQTRSTRQLRTGRSHADRGYGTLNKDRVGRSASSGFWQLLKSQHLSLYVDQTSNSLPNLASAQVLKPWQCLLVNVCKHCISSPSKLLFSNSAEFHAIHPELAQEVFYRRQPHFVLLYKVICHLRNPP